jgi:hypothetical protein
MSILDQDESANETALRIRRIREAFADVHNHSDSQKSATMMSWRNAFDQKQAWRNTFKQKS